MKKNIIVIGMIFLFSLKSLALSQINIATFNLKWFGINGDLQGTQPEKRLGTIKNFINANLVGTHVFVFEEVVVLEDLKYILPAGWECVSYSNNNSIHQYVAICATPYLKLAKVSYDDNYTIEEVALGSDRMRPAVRIDIQERRSQKILLTLVGVHLKALPNETRTRVLQAAEISKDLAKIPQGRPVVITGDLNTYLKTDTQLGADDVQLILQALNSVAKGYYYVPHKPNAYTFRSDRYRSQFDQFYVRGSMRVLQYPEVFPVCSAQQDGAGYLNFAYYYKNVSDHCPTSIQIAVP